ELAENAICLFLIWKGDLLLAAADESGFEGESFLWRPRRQSGGQAPVFDRLKSLNISFAVDNQAHGNGLDAARRKILGDFAPEQRANSVAHQSVQYAPRLLGLN